MDWASDVLWGVERVGSLFYFDGEDWQDGKGADD